MTTGQRIILGFHYHLPVGVSNDVFEKIYLSKLKPFFQILYQYPKIPFVLHLSGTLLHKIERKYSEIFMLISEMVQRKQIELVSGGFYEPMMPLLLPPDRTGQIEMLTTYLRKNFGKRTHGCWIPNAAWEQSVVSAIARSGLQYTFVDEKKIAGAGLAKSQYNFPCISEDKGDTIIIFPVFSSLKERILEKGASLVFGELLAEHSGTPFLRTVFPDFFSGKISFHIAQENYINKFFEDISLYENKITFTLPSKVQKSNNALQRIYFPAKDYKTYLIDYPEAGLVYAKMMKTKALIEKLKGDKERKKNAQEELWKAQDISLFCTDGQYEGKTAGSAAYSGTYNTALRNTVYSAMLEAERIIREEGTWKKSLSVVDFDFDGVNEYLFQGDLMNCFVREKGAVLFELDYIPKTWNYQNTIALFRAGKTPVRFRETAAAFFDMLTLQEYMVESGVPKVKRELGGEIFKAVNVDRIHQSVSFYTGVKEDPFGSLGITKSYELAENILTVRYEIVNTGSEIQSCKLITQINLSFPDASETTLRLFAYKMYESFVKNGEKTAIPANQELVSNIEAIDFQDLLNEAIINLSSDGIFDAHISSIYEKYKNPLDEFEDIYQWTRVLTQKNIVLKAGEKTSFFFKLGIHH